MERCTERAVCPVSKGETPCAGYSWRQVSHPWRSPASLQRSPAAAAAEAIPTAAAAEIRTPAAAAVEAPLHLPVEAVTVTADMAAAAVLPYSWAAAVGTATAAALRHSWAAVMAVAEAWRPCSPEAVAAMGMLVPPHRR